MLEKTIEKAVCDYAKSRGCFVHKMQTARGGTGGMPDRLFHYRGRTWYIEMKRFGGKLSALQTACIDDLRYHKIHVYVVDNVEYGRSIIDDAVPMGGG